MKHCRWLKLQALGSTPYRGDSHLNSSSHWKTYAPHFLFRFSSAFPLFYNSPFFPFLRRWQKKNFFAEQAKFGYKTFYVEIKVGWLFSHKRECVNKDRIYRWAQHNFPQKRTDKGVILLISGRKIPEKFKGDRGLKKEENSMYIYAKKKSFLFFENLKSLDFSVHVIPN